MRRSASWRPSLTTWRPAVNASRQSSAAASSAALRHPASSRRATARRRSSTPRGASLPCQMACSATTTAIPASGGVATSPPARTRLCASALRRSQQRAGCTPTWRKLRWRSTEMWDVSGAPYSTAVPAGSAKIVRTYPCWRSAASARPNSRGETNKSASLYSRGASVQSQRATAGPFSTNGVTPASVRYRQTTAVCRSRSRLRIAANWSGVILAGIAALADRGSRLLGTLVSLADRRLPKP